MAKGDTTLKMEFLTAGEARAVNAIREVYGAQDTGMKKQAKQANILGLSMRKLARSVAYGVSGYVGVQGVNAAASALTSGANEFANAQINMEKAITPLSSLGDNAGKLPELRAEVVDLGALVGTTNQEIADFLFDLQSNTGNLSDEIRDNLKYEILELARATGGRLVTAQNLLTKAYQISGKEVENLNELQNKLMFTQEKASLRFEDLAARAPEVLAAGQVVGVTMNEVLASIIGATKKSGNIEKTFTGLRNVFLLMEEAQKKGITLTGSYTNKLGQLRDHFSTNSERMRKLFGQESIVAAKVLADSVDDVSNSLKDLQSITGDTDAAQEKLAKRFEDTAHASAKIMQINQSLRDNAAFMPQGDVTGNFWGSHKRQMDLGALGMATYTGSNDRLFGSLGSLFGVLGLGKFVEAGQYAELQHTPPGPERQTLLREEYEREKAKKLASFQADGLTLTDILSGSYNRKYRAQRDRYEESLPTFDEYIDNHPVGQRGVVRASDEARQLAASPEGQELIKALRENTDAIKRQGDRGRVGTPGGGQMNAQEAY